MSGGGNFGKNPTEPGESIPKMLFTTCGWRLAG